MADQDSGNIRQDCAVREHLDDWPYVPQYLQQSLDWELIERHGEALLYRSLNTGRTVCFVGSGISMAYGRLGWGDMVRRLADQLLEDPRVKKEELGSMIGRLRDSLKTLREDGGSADRNRYPTIFQYVEQLSLALQPLGRRDPSNPSVDMRAMARALMHDDRGHAHLLFSDLMKDLEQLFGQGTPPNLLKGGEFSPRNLAELFVRLPNHTDLTRESVDEIRLGAGIRGPDRSWLKYLDSTLLDTQALELLAKESLGDSASLDGEKKWASEILTLVKELARLKKLGPVHRFLVPSLLRLYWTNSMWEETLLDARASTKNGFESTRLETLANPRAWKKIVDTEVNTESQTKLKNQAMNLMVREELIPANADPLALLAGDLGMDRFLTTNYDLDIERLLRDRGFAPSRQSASGSAGRRAGEQNTHQFDALGAESRDGVFNASRALDLVEFSVQHPDHAYQLMHLHGRATHGDDMVITERDYLERYLRKGDEADLVDMAISLTFAANPMVFVGSGMSEDDVLRPLRQFVAERRHRMDRKAVVLIPDKGDRRERLSETVYHYNRFGVFTVHYGEIKVKQNIFDEASEKDKESELNGRQESKPEGGQGCGRKPELASGESGVEVTVPWLSLMLAMCRDLEGWHKSFQAWVSQISADANLVDDLKQASRAFESAIDIQDSENVEASCRNYFRWVNLLILQKNSPSEDAVWRELVSQNGSERTSVGSRLFNESIAERGLLLWVFNLTKTMSVLNTPERQLSVIDMAKWRRLSMCASTILRELPTALTSRSLTVKLAELRAGWAEWKISNERLPEFRRNGGPRWSLKLQKSESTPNPEGAEVSVLARHPVALRALNQAGAADALPGPQRNAPETDRFIEDSPSRTFDTLKRTLEKNRDQRGSLLSLGPTEIGRRVFVLLAARGVGKGHFFETLRMPGHLQSFCNSSWPQGRAPTYDNLAHFNLSFCHEVVSVFDRLTNILVERASEVFEPTDEASSASPVSEIREAYRRLKRNRVICLQRILELYAEHALVARQRQLVAFNGFNYLFDERGHPKNAQVQRLVMALLGPAADAAPIDFVLVCAESGFPRLFQTPLPPRKLKSLEVTDTWSALPSLAFDVLVHDDSGEKGRRDVEAFATRLRLNVRGEFARKRRMSTGRIDGRGAAFFHVLRGARASSTVAKYFPEVALSLAACPGELSGNNLLGNRSVVLNFPAAAGMAGYQKTVIEVCGEKDVKPGREPVLGLLVGLCGLGADKVGESWDQYLKEFKSSECTEYPAALVEDFKYLFRELDKSRFLLTIVCAAASEVGWDNTLKSNGDRRLDARQLLNWLRQLLADHIGAGPSQRADAVIAAIFSSYQSGHNAGRLVAMRGMGVGQLTDGLMRLERMWPEEWKTSFKFEAARLASEASRQLAGPHGWILQQHLLWHLAVAGHPVEADVLAEAPKLRRICMEIIQRAALVGGDIPNIETLQAIRWPMTLRRQLTRLVVGLGLDLLVHRCLVFRLHQVSLEGSEALLRDANDVECAAAANNDQKSGKGPGDGTSDIPLWRFALHRHVQRAIFRRLHSPYVEYPQVDQFSLSMWVTQPDELPRPSPSAAHDIAELMAAWTGYPARPERINRECAYYSALHDACAQVVPQNIEGAWDNAVLSLPARMLRAALGVVRSVYSVNVVSRYQDQAYASAEELPPEGYVEQHRLQIRWMLKKATELPLALVSKLPEAKRSESRSRLPGTAKSPFFVEEVVWLYNECGLLCLVQGRLEAAAGMFRRALRTAREIEPANEQGALWCRIHLNQAMVDIERGRIRAARVYLTAIRDRQDENPILRLLAKGFIGLTDHLAGDLERAERTYQQVIVDLEDYGQSRSIAIFSRHLADLYRAKGPNEHVQALAAADRAIARATQAGHEDIRQLARLSRLRLRIDQHPTGASEPILNELDEIERFGRQMGMPRLLAEVAYARASLLLHLGEVHHACRLAISSLEIATSSDLRLRQITALALLAKACERRGMVPSAHRLLARAGELAESCNYTTARASALRATVGAT